MNKTGSLSKPDEHDIVPASYLAAYQRGVTMLRRAGLSNAANEAMWLAESGLGVSRLTVLADRETPISPDKWKQTLEKFDRRVAQEPLQYILGTQEFRGLCLNVTEGVFIPRPETELLLDEVHAHTEKETSPILVDIGTGSGCIAIAMAVENPNARIMAVDQSSTAIATAKDNAIRNKVQDRIAFMRGDWLAPLQAQGLENNCSCIVSNPPYIPHDQLASLPTTVRDFEPSTALNGGRDGLEFHFRLLQGAPRLLRPGGYLIMEMGEKQVERLSDAVAQREDFKVCRIREDDAGIPRIICLRRVG